MRNMHKGFFYLFTLLFALGVSPLAASAATLAVQSLAPGSSNIAINTPITFTVVATGFSSPVYTITSDVGTNLAPYLSAAGNFSWTPGLNDAGTHNITISATDGAGNSASVAQQLSITKPSITLSSMVNGPTAYVGKPMTFQITPVGFTNPTYWIGDEMYPTTLTNARLSASGAFYWVPVYADIGTHKALITVADQQGRYAELSQTITVSPQPKPEIQSLSPGTTTPVGETLSFSVTSPGFTSPTFLVADEYTPTTIAQSNMSTNGSFSWVPVRSQTGKHNIRVLITDSTGQSATVMQQIIVEDPVLEVTGITTGDTVAAGTQVKFNVLTRGLKNPTFAVRDNYPGGSSVTTNTISSSGLFVWTPTMGDVGTHNLELTATDVFGNYAAVRVDIKVVSTPVAAVPATPPPTTVSVTPPVSPTTPTPAPSVQTPPAYTFTRALAIGSAGADVTALQQLLKQLGYFTAAPTGTFGPLTAAAVKKFQSAMGLEQVGNVGPATRAKLNAVSGTQSGVSLGQTYRFTIPLALGASGTEVTELQKKLTKLGYYTGVINGTFDYVTLAAVKKFQAAKGLEQVGSVGPATRAALNSQ